MNVAKARCVEVDCKRKRTMLAKSEEGQQNCELKLPCHSSSPVLQNMGVGLAVLEMVVGMIAALPEVTATTLMV